MRSSEKKIKSVVKGSRNFIQRINDPMFIVDDELKIQYINDIALKALGYSRNDVEGKMSCADLCRTPLCHSDKCTIKSCMVTKKSIIGQTMAETKSGQKIPVRASCNVILDAKGNAIGGYEIISDITVLDDGFLSNMNDAAFRTDTNLVVQNINNAALKALGYTKEEVLGKMTCADLCKTPLCGTEQCTIKKCMSTKGNVVGETIAYTKTGQQIPVRAACGVLLDVNGEPCGGFEIISDNTDLMKMIENLQVVSEGDLSIEIEESMKDRDDVIGKVANAVDSMVKQLTGVIGNIVNSAQNLAQAVEQISSGNQNLSQRTSEQASALEEIASTIEESAATIKQNADNAQEANVRAAQTNTQAQEGGQVTTNAIDAIYEINDSSKKIGEIISVINEISFQTNLLALNAAVEAARAGEQGRGFAVVAGEVRNLAQRSSSAAKQIEVLIKDSLEKVSKGTDLAGKSGKSLETIIESVKTVNQLITEISAASEEQRQGMDQISNAIIEMDTMTQQNASLVEETAAASEEMANQAQELLEMVQQFRFTEEVQKKIDGSKGADRHANLGVRPGETKKTDSAGSNGNGNRKQLNQRPGLPESDKGRNIHLPELNNIMKDQGFAEF
ncbi:MAG: PAS domain-containing protein [Spirochaetes bacterium]|nr:PAS domain-containing protein [Spirochaetota bacterium]